MRLEAERAGDLAAIRAVHAAAFGRQGEADLVDELRQGDWAEISLVAKPKDQVVGHVLFSRLEAPMRALALAPIAVHPERQRSGIGSALIREGLARAAAGGWDAVLVLGDPAYYERFGFRCQTAAAYDCAYAGPYLLGLELTAGRREPGEIRYPPPFAALA